MFIMKKEILEQLRIRLLQVYFEENKNKLIFAKKDGDLLKGGELENEA